MSQLGFTEAMPTWIPTMPCSDSKPSYNRYFPKYRLWKILGLLTMIIFCNGGKVDIVDEVTVIQQNNFIASLKVALTDVVRNNMVNVTCSQQQLGPTTSILVFGYSIFPVGSRNGNISIRIIKAGSSSSVACFGFSLNNGMQFLSANSTGRLGTVIVQRAPSVSICSDYVNIKGYTNSIQSFTVQLSEPAVSPVIVNCYVTNESSNIANSLKLTFSPATVPQQQNVATVMFRVLSSGQPVKVFCRAQSQNCLPPASSSVLPSVAIPSTSLASTPRPTSSLMMNFTSTTSSNATKTSSWFSVPNSTSIFTNASTYIPVATLNETVIAISSSSFISVPLPELSPFAAVTPVTNSTPSTVLSLSSSLNNTRILSLNSTFSILSPRSSPSFFPSLTLSSSLSSVSISSSVLSTPLPQPTTTACQFLYETSQATSVNFVVKPVSITAYPSYTDFNNLGDHVSYIALDEPLEGSSDLILQCRIKNIGYGDAGGRVCETNGLPIGGAQELALTDVTISLLESTIILKPGALFGSLTVRISRFGNSSFAQLFHAFCCAPSSNEKYRGQSVSVYLWLDGKGTVPFDWKTIPGQQQRVMTTVESLDFSCPCNLKENVCDLNCCCDKNCSPSEISKFSCTEGAFGGRERSSFEFDCSAVWPDRTDWTPILCVVTNNSPFLGYFYKYTTPSVALTANDFKTLTVGKTVYDFAENEAGNSYDGDTIGYTFGSSIKTDIGFLTIPSLVDGSSCIFTSVRYLIDQTSSCLQRVSAETCGSDTFDALNYILPTGLTFPSCKVPEILDGTTGTSLAPTTVEYYCATDPANYVYARANPLLVSLEAQESLFASQVSGSSQEISRCSFDDGKSRPPQPSIDNTTNTCKNAVFDVNYDITWNAKEIKAVTAKITLGTIPLNTFTQTAVTYTYYTQIVVTSSLKAPSSLYSFTPSLSYNVPSLFHSTLGPSSVSGPVISTASSTYNGTINSSSVPSISGSSFSFRPSSASSSLSSYGTMSSVNSVSRSSVPSINSTVKNSMSSLPSTLVSPSMLSPILPTTLSALNSTNLTALTATSSVIPSVIPSAFPSAVHSTSPLASIVPVSHIVRTLTVKTTTVLPRNLTITRNVLQKFAVSYRYEKSIGINASAALVSNQTASTVVSLSGNPGYVIGRPLITRSNFSANAASTDGLMLWKTTSNGFCSNAKLVSVPFGRNSLSGCSLRFGLDKLSNCSSLILLIKENQERLVKAIQVARRGNPSINNAIDWLDIIRVEPTVVERSLTRPGVCYDVPAHLIMEVLVSEAGMRYGQAQMEISGLKIRYITETWSLACSSGARSACYNSTDSSSKFMNPFMRSFYITSSVVFVRIPPADPPRIKRSAVASGICKYDSCLMELFYPITDLYSHNVAEFALRFTQEATAAAMTLIFIAFGALYVSRSWGN